MKNATHNRIRRIAPLLILAGLASPASIVSAGVNVWASAGLSGRDISAVAINPANPVTLYAAGGGGVFKSTDSGGTWATANAGLTDVNINALAIDPSAPATLYAGSASWEDASHVFKSTDGGANWTESLTSGSVFALVIDPSTPLTVFAATRGGVFKSANGGRSWAASSAGQTTSEVFALAIDSSAPTTLYAGGDGGIFKSTDSGGTWIAVNTGLTNTNVYALAIDPSAPATLYAGTFGGGVFKSSNGGKGWAAVNTGMTNPGVLVLAIDPADPAKLYAGTGGGGVFKSTNGGGNWTAINAGLTTTIVQALAIDPSNPATIYAGTPGAGVFKSINGGGISANGGAWLLPSSAHSTGGNGAFYTTNLAVANVGAAPASFTMKFLDHDQDGSSGPEQTFNLESGKSVTYLDVLGSVFHQTSGFGAIRITSSTSSLNVVSVTSTPGFGGTLSQTIPAVRASDLIPAGSHRSILYIREGDGFRSNLILASNADVSTTVDAALVSPAGTTLATKSYSVPPNGMTQNNRVVRDMGVSGSITGARLVLSSSTPEASFTAFASVIDETTNDPTAVEAE